MLLRRRLGGAVAVGGAVEVLNKVGHRFSQHHRLGQRHILGHLLGLHAHAACELVRVGHRLCVGSGLAIPLDVGLDLAVTVAFGVGVGVGVGVAVVVCVALGERVGLCGCDRLELAEQQHHRSGVGERASECVRRGECRCLVLSVGLGDGLGHELGDANTLG